MEFGQGESDDEAEVEIQPRKENKQKSRSGTPGWSRFNVERSKRRLLESDMKKTKQCTPTRRLHGKHTVRTTKLSVLETILRQWQDQMSTCEILVLNLKGSNSLQGDRGAKPPNFHVLDVFVEACEGRITGTVGRLRKRVRRSNHILTNISN